MRQERKESQQKVHSWKNPILLWNSEKKNMNIQLSHQRKLEYLSTNYNQLLVETCYWRVLSALQSTMERTDKLRGKQFHVFEIGSLYVGMLGYSQVQGNMERSQRPYSSY